ncbi:MAG: hypothetical protein F6J96_20800 [Symploca sp. SIO1C2]|nr:hypothetical protein [Symploca sp. SIO1C2]
MPDGDMLHSRLTRLYRKPYKWLCVYEHEIDNVVDGTAAAENLLPAEMRNHLIKPYQNYVAIWDSTVSQIAAEFLDKEGEQQAYSTAVTSLSLRDSYHD